MTSGPLLIAANAARYASSFAYIQWQIRKLIRELALAVFMMLVAAIMASALLIGCLAGFYTILLQDGMENFRAILFTIGVATFLAGVLACAAWFCLRRGNDRSLSASGALVNAFFDGLLANE